MSLHTLLTRKKRGRWKKRKRKDKLKDRKRRWKGGTREERIDRNRVYDGNG